jgi:predicted metal-dependent hydrolase
LYGDGVMDIGDDPRFLDGVAAINAHDYFDASEMFEDLFFEAVRGEVVFARLFLQVAVGAHHLERGQRGAAVDRLLEALKALNDIDDDRGWDLARLRDDVRTLIASVRAGEPFTWPEVFRRQ